MLYINAKAVHLLYKVDYQGSHCEIGGLDPHALEFVDVFGF